MTPRPKQAIGFSPCPGPGSLGVGSTCCFIDFRRRRSPACRPRSQSFGSTGAFPAARTRIWPVSIAQARAPARARVQPRASCLWQTAPGRSKSAPDYTLARPWILLEIGEWGAKTSGSSRFCVVDRFRPCIVHSPKPPFPQAFAPADQVNLSAPARLSSRETPVPDQ